MGVKLRLSHLGKNTLRVFENRVLRRTFELERNEMIGWRKL
jgi:hypothetical protein